MKTIALDTRLKYFVPAFVLLAAQSLQAAASTYSLDCSGSQYVFVPASSSLTPTPVTFEAWVNPSASACNTILSRGDGGTGSP